MKSAVKSGLRAFLILAFMGLVLLYLCGPEPLASDEKGQQVSNHFNGTHYYNPGAPQLKTPAGQEPRRGASGWIWRWVFGNDWPEWPAIVETPAGPLPVTSVPKGALRITPIGHATFLIQMDGLNILTDPIWSDRCSPLSWAGPKRHRTPGIRFEDLPTIDVVLVSHNHYDHLDLPTLERLAKKGTLRSIAPLGNQDLIRGAGIPTVNELDWWQSVRLSPDVTVTLVPAQHFSARTLWDRNKTLWGGFVVSGPSGNVFYAGDTGYGPHFREIARHFPSLRVVILPISPFRLQPSKEAPPVPYPGVHMGPSEAVQAHIDLGAQVSVAAHFQVFQLGSDGFDDAPKELASTLKRRKLEAGVFIVPTLGQAMQVPPMMAISPQLAGQAQCAGLGLIKHDPHGNINLKEESIQ